MPARTLTQGSITRQLIGLTLPLLSYGGSSMLVTLAWLGVLLRVHHETQTTGRAAVAREERRP